MWTDLLLLLVPVVIGTIVVRLLGEAAVPRETLGKNPRTLVTRPKSASKESAEEADGDPG